jgi:hypothetical protein
MAYVYSYNSDQLTNADKKTIEKYFSSRGLEIYREQPELSDALLREIKPGSMTNMKQFISDWAKIGRRAPSGYFRAFFLMNLGFFYPEKSYPDTRMWHGYIEYQCFDVDLFNPGFVSIKRHSLFPQLNNELSWLYGEHTMHGIEEPVAFSYLPLVSTLSKLGIYVWLILFVVFYSFYASKREIIVPIAFWIGYSVTIMLAPVIYYRYGAPLVFLAPLIVSMLFVKRQEIGDKVYEIK